MDAPAGSRITVHYIGTLDNGRIFASTTEEEPLVFTAGEGELFPRLEEEIAGMEVGEVRNILIPCADAFGPRLQKNIIKVHRSTFPHGKVIAPGDKVAVEFGGKGERVMVVAAVDADGITLDGNHPLAGQDLTFALKVVAVSRELAEQHAPPLSS
ncbi:FKBP-type peptidyl-prolyl cis-trans isomerase [Geomonas sp. RF6]|uniref:FKBP-type peptidyl-prolyl cis-trans isomerase n=1 Tax=Geomonas sp. RF6 TaxID=2897342 RepID=UPI001E2D218D|nr:FKBP-type peptidyl-prolyl cis-trans isomerase [Geomonas sp. RF6]UFS68619.1 FKBP-type peptidyl-prolyl cis-trans isomerase [Geomonas sp. RF6]